MVLYTAADPAPPGLARKSCEGVEARLSQLHISVNLTLQSSRARGTACEVHSLEINTITDHDVTKERILPKTILEILFITLAVSETRT